jgi:hypothetical protein
MTIINLDKDFKPFGEGIEFQKFDFPSGCANVPQTCEGNEFKNEFINLKQNNNMENKFLINRLTLAFASLLLAAGISSCSIE